MKQILVFVFFALILPAGSALAHADPKALSKSSSFLLEANVTDLYDWSKDRNKYSLKESHFSFKIWDLGVPGGKSKQKTARLMPISPNDDLPEQEDKKAQEALISSANIPITASLVDEGHVTQKSSASSARYLSVSRDKVSIESASGEISVKSRLSEKKDSLDIYLSDLSKQKILDSLLKISKKDQGSLVFSKDSTEDSNYHCTLNKNQQLVCSIKYLSRSL